MGRIDEVCMIVCMLNLFDDFPMWIKWSKSIGLGLGLGLDMATK